MNAVKFLKRAFQVCIICLKHLMGALLNRVLRRQGPDGPTRMRLALEEMSGSFIKFGQILALQIDLIPPAYCDTLLDLLDRVPPFSADQVRKTFSEEFGRPPEELYRTFDYQPFASASIGQVHRAVSKKGKVVAVKVQRPNVREIFRRDAILLRVFVKLVFFLRLRSLYFLRDPVREFNDWIHDELDYRREAGHADFLGRNARETPSEKIPRIDWSRTTSRILTMDFLQGFSVSEYLGMRSEGNSEGLEKLRSIGFKPARFVTTVITNFVSDALRFGVFHADLHPANLLILKDNTVGYVDFGIVGSLTPEARRKVIQLTLAYVGGKIEDIYFSFLDICDLSESADLAAFRSDLEEKCQTWYRKPPIGGTVHLSTSLNLAMIDLLDLCRTHGLLPNKELIRYIRSVVLADGLVSRLAPGLDYGNQLRELCEDYFARQIRNKIFSTKATLPMLADLTGWLQSGPTGMLKALELMERRQFGVRANVTAAPARNRGRNGPLFWAALVWSALCISLALNWPLLWRDPLTLSVSASLALLLLWTAWLIYLLRHRLRRQ